MAGKLPLPWKQAAFKDFTLKVVPDDARYGEYGEKVKVKARGETIEKQVALAGRIGILNVETEPYCEGDVFLDGKKAGAAQESFNLLWAHTRCAYPAPSRGLSRGLSMVRAYRMIKAMKTCWEGRIGNPRPAC